MYWCTDVCIFVCTNFRPSVWALVHHTASLSLAVVCGQFGCAAASRRAVVGHFRQKHKSMWIVAIVATGAISTATTDKCRQQSKKVANLHFLNRRDAPRSFCGRLLAVTTLTERGTNKMCKCELQWRKAAVLILLHATVVPPLASCWRCGSCCCYANPLAVIYQQWTLAGNFWLQFQRKLCVDVYGQVFVWMCMCESPNYIGTSEISFDEFWFPQSFLLCLHC